MQETNSSIVNDEASELTDRVAAVEKALSKLKKNSLQSWIDVLSKLIIPVVLPVFLFYLTFTIKDSVQQALEYRRLEVTSAEAMEELLQELHESTASQEDASAAALTLATYGEGAIMPLIGALEHSSSNAESGIQHGLFILGLVHPEAVTKALDSVLSKRRGQFRWQTHKISIELLGQIAHPLAKDILDSYKSLLERSPEEGLANWQKAVRDADTSSYKDTQEALIEALARLSEVTIP